MEKHSRYYNFATKDFSPDIEDAREVTAEQVLKTDKRGEKILANLKKMKEKTFGKDLISMSHLTTKGAVIGLLGGGIYALYKKKSLFLSCLIGALAGAFIGNFIGQKFVNEENES